jgi:hypothetical protein
MKWMHLTLFMRNQLRKKGDKQDYNSIKSVVKKILIKINKNKSYLDKLVKKGLLAIDMIQRINARIGLNHQCLSSI